MRNLLLTLGHNSSAILIEDGAVVAGYETERLTGLKSDSQFPKQVIDRFGGKFDMAYVTHWSPSSLLADLSRKHWRPEELDGVPIVSHGPELTHHDTHIHAAMAYAGSFFLESPNTYGLVIDGFGSFGEHLSLYWFQDGQPKLIRRIHGYETSLGLWYQYATAFMGMRMHEDEYKLLGYEVHCPSDAAEHLDNLAELYAGTWLDNMSKSIYGSQYDPMYSLGALDAIREKHFKNLSGICRILKIEDPTSYTGRTCLSYYVQKVLERVVHRILDNVPFQNLLCSGGVFYNVKLNKTILDRVSGKLCVYPLAGDQGNSLGLYAKLNPSFRFPKSLCIGRRQLPNYGFVEGLHHMAPLEAFDKIIGLLHNVGYVNIVRGDMEFGPRALCNTSTLALPYSSIVARINRMNDRNTVMPMAPVVTRQMYRKLFLRTEHVWRSEDHMIVAMEYSPLAASANIQGVCHPYTKPYAHMTGRPQVIDDSDEFMNALLTEVGHPLINTSFNYHGEPIAFDSADVIRNHVMQRRNDPLIETIIITS